MASSTSKRSAPSAAWFLLAALFFFQCDIPTEGPDFEVSTSVRAPLILDKTFVLLGPGEEGLEALIDTTAASFDTLFSVEPTTNVLLIEQALDDFEIGDLNGLVDEIEVDPISVQVGIGGLESQTFNATPFGTPIGLFTTPEVDLGSAPVNSGVPSYPIGSVLVPPSVNLLSLSDVSVESVVLSDRTDNVNRFTFTLTNGLASATLTDGSGGSPAVILERPGFGEIARATFAGTITAGASRTASMSVAATELTSDTVYRLAIGTNQGAGAIDADPTGVQIRTVVAPLEYADTRVSGISAQADIDASGDAITLNSDNADFSGILAAGGELTITLDNTLPIGVTLTELTVRNLGPVGSIAAPSVMIDLNDLAPGTNVTIPADGTLELVFPLDGAAIANEIDVVVKASSPGAGASTVISDADGIFTSVEGVVEVNQLFFTPDSEVFTSNGLIDIAVDDVSFEAGTDYIELQGGTLAIEELANEMDLDFERLLFSLPGFRVAPYTPADSLVITFQGPSENPNGLRYSGLKRGDTKSNIAVDLTGVRIYPTGDHTVYHVYGVSDSGLPSALNVADRIRASIAPEDLEIRTVHASMEPISVALSDDVDGDDRLDVFNDDEAKVMDLGSLDSVRDLEIDGLQLNGTELTFAIETNIGADIVFYTAMVGIQDDGTQVFLRGRGDLAVSPVDTMAAQFLLNGAPIDATNLLAFPIPGAADPDSPTTHTVRITHENSNLDEFLSSLPREMRYVGKGIVQGMNGQRVQLQKPYVLNAGLNAGIPVSLADDASYTQVFDVDLSDLADLTDPDNDVQVNGAALIIQYENAIPIGIDAAIEVLDAVETAITALPDVGEDAWMLVAAQADDEGLATGATSGTLEFAISDDQLRAMSAGEKVRLRLTLRTNEGRPATLRASDTLQISVQGRFDMNVPVSFD